MEGDVVSLPDPVSDSMAESEEVLHSVPRSDEFDVESGVPSVLETERMEESVEPHSSSRVAPVPAAVPFVATMKTLYAPSKDRLDNVLVTVGRQAQPSLQSSSTAFSFPTPSEPLSVLYKDEVGSFVSCVIFIYDLMMIEVSDDYHPFPPPFLFPSR